MANLLRGFTTPKLTDEEFQAGKQKREAFSKTIDTFLIQIQDSQVAFTKLSLPSTLEKTGKDANAWLKANIEVSPRDVDKEQTLFNESVKTAVKDIIQKLPTAVSKLSEEDRKIITNLMKYPPLVTPLSNAVQNYTKEVQEKQRADEKAAIERTGGDDFQDALKIVGKVMIFLIVFIVALRLGSYAANASLHLPTPYRILNFIYTALFSPVLFFYYLFFILRNYFFPGSYAPLRIEAMLPFYEIKEEKTWTDPLFGYTPTSEVLTEIIKKQADLEKRRQEALTT